MNKFITGGWSQSLAGQPHKAFDVMMYGMVTNLDGLTTGTSPSQDGARKNKTNPIRFPALTERRYGFTAAADAPRSKSRPMRMKC
ncbi:hypothetical protein V6280_01065 [Serratia marcescens]|uniref:hypothetical protein n=1 Tax=Serratia marcescens TaxID=615 RepID=UPI0036FF2DD2